MNENAETKICPFCAETVKAAAKKCPFCNSRLVRYALFRQELAIGLAGLTTFGAFIWVCVLFVPYDSDGGRNKFARHRDDLDTRDVNVVVSRENTNDYYYDVTGFVTNKGNYPWRVQSIELTITNSQRTPDVVHASVGNSFVVQPHTKHAFALHERTSLTNSVTAERARIENAIDGNAPMPNGF